MIYLLKCYFKAGGMFRLAEAVFDYLHLSISSYSGSFVFNITCKFHVFRI
jgi:hypothetical protein